MPLPGQGVRSCRDVARNESACAVRLDALFLSLHGGRARVRARSLCLPLCAFLSVSHSLCLTLRVSLS